MKNILTVAAKELKEALRDKRTLIFMVVFPLVTFPLLINIISSVTGSYIEKEKEKTVKIGISGTVDDNNMLLTTICSFPNTKLIAFEDTTGAEKLLRDDSLDVMLHFPSDFDSEFNGQGTGVVTVIHEGTEEGSFARIRMIVDTLNKMTVISRLHAAGLTQEFIEPIRIDEKNVSSVRETVAKYAGGMLPYFFIAFAFMGCLYPAIDMFAGEKERGTIETLLTAPVPRWQILTGKMMVVAISGLLSATLTMIGLFVSLQFMDMPGELMGLVNDLLKPGLILTIYLMMIPLIIFFTGLMVPVSIYSKSFKEAQSMLTPLNMLLVLPSIAGFLPGIELNTVTALIPVVNIVLATKDIIAGNPDMGLIAIAFTTLVLFAVASVVLSFKQFGKEGNILR
jgi:sodium transport system permease protein